MTVGFFDSSRRAVGVVATGAAVAPLEGACWTPGAVEPATRGQRSRRAAARASGGREVCESTSAVGYRRGKKG